MAEAMINGDDCETCGEHLGEGSGFPRKCKACSGGKKSKQNIDSLLTGYDVKKFTDFHWRINDELDIWPSKNKYHVLETDERGTYTNLKDLLAENFEGAELHDMLMLESIAASILPELVNSNSPEDAAKKAFDYAEAFLKESEKRNQP